MQSGFDSKLGTRRSPDASAPKADDSSPDGSSNPEAPKQPVIGIDADGTPIDITPGAPPPGNGRSIGYATGPMGAGGVLFSGTQFNDLALLQLDSGNNVTGFTGPYPGRALDEPATWSIGTSANTDTGFDTLTVLRWGRWSGGIANGVSAERWQRRQHRSRQSKPALDQRAGCGATGHADHGLPRTIPSSAQRRRLTTWAIPAYWAVQPSSRISPISLSTARWSSTSAAPPGRAAGSGTFGEDPNLPPYLFCRHLWCGRY